MNVAVLTGHGQGHKPMDAGAKAWRHAVWWAAVASLVVVAGCSSRRVSQPAPVEDRTVVRSGPIVAGAPSTESAPGAGFYTVKPGDTIYRIALQSGQKPADIQLWNNLSNPNLIEVGQVLRVMPPVAGATAAAPGSAGVTTTAIAGPGVASRPLTAPPGATAPAADAAAPTAVSSTAAAAPEPAQPLTGDELAFVWPAQGAVVAPFDEARNKGVAIAGRLGDPVLAAADGRVVYAGAGLRGYGNLIILKHNNTFLTAYAHNQALLVREDQAVRQGQRIAEMGSSDADRVKLHFEVRRQGKPVDPLAYLPKR